MPLALVQTQTKLNNTSALCVTCGIGVQALKNILSAEKAVLGEISFLVKTPFSWAGGGNFAKEMKRRLPVRSCCLPSGAKV